MASCSQASLLSAQFFEKFKGATILYQNQTKGTLVHERKWLTLFFGILNVDSKAIPKAQALRHEPL